MGSNAITKEDLRQELERFATKKDLEAFASKKDLHTAIDSVRDELRGEIRGVGAKVEQLESVVRGLAEGLVATREQLERRIDSVDERLSGRIGVVEEVVRQNSTDIRRMSALIQVESGDVAELKRDVREMRDQLARREKLDELETRVGEVERRVGIGRK